LRCSFDLEFSVDAGEVDLDGAGAIVGFCSDFEDIAALSECLKDFLFGGSEQVSLDYDGIRSPRVVNDFDVGIG